MNQIHGREFNSDFTLKDCLFGDVTFTKNADLNKYLYNGYSIGFSLRSELSLPDSSVGKNVIIIGVDMSSLVHFDNKEKHILILGKCPTQRLDDTKLTAEAIQLIFQDLVKIFLEPAL